MSKRYEIRLGGSGGQGIILGGVILAEAAAIYDGKHATQSQAYGPESRGGASKAEVIISDTEIDYPKAISIDFLLSMTQESCTKHHVDLKEGGILLVDSGEVTDFPEGNYKIYKAPITELARDKVGKVIAANIVAIGMVTELSGILSKEAVEQAVLARVPKGTEEINKKALQVGYDEAARLKG